MFPPFLNLWSRALKIRIFYCVVICDEKVDREGGFEDSPREVVYKMAENSLIFNHHLKGEQLIILTF